MEYLRHFSIISKTINQRARYDKTSKSKDIIIIAKDKKIKELEEENKKLKDKLEILRGKLYEKYSGTDIILYYIYKKS
ncbi:MAG: hypothetical protein ACRC8M_02555 [Cetobacterium sp.]